MLLYLCQDGLIPSGVATYGYHVLHAWPRARMLLLNADRLPLAAPSDLESQITTILESESHNPSIVAKAIGQLAEKAEGGLTILPNTGDTPWTATAEWLQQADDQTRMRTRLLGIVHSDVETQYALSERYHAIAPLWVGVSRKCTTELLHRLAGKNVTVHELPYPIAVPEVGTRTDRGPLRLAYVGRLEEQQKRVSRLVRLFKILVSIGVDFTATVVGDGPAAEEFGAAVSAAGQIVESRVRITGALDRAGINEVWRKHDVALLVSVFEGLPLAMLEAMAAGVCPVMMAIGSGLEELIHDGVEGRIVPQGDVDEMAAVLAVLAHDHKMLRRMSAAARSRVLTTFSPERHFAKLHGIMDQLWRLPAPASAELSPDPTAAAIKNLTKAAAVHRRPVAIYGAGMVGRKVMDVCLAKNLEVCGWYDSDPARVGTVYRGLVCKPPAGMVELSDAVFVAASLQFSSAIKSRIQSSFADIGMAVPVIVEHQP